MIRPIHCQLVAVLVLLGTTVQAAETQRYYVSIQGNDRWSGRLAEAAADGSDGPFATLPRECAMGLPLIRKYAGRVWARRNRPVGAR
ncbi:MAG: hypothetical protein ACUVXJ_07470 [Phycisphaerae bacterium]